MRYPLQLTLFFLILISSPLVLTLINDNSGVLQSERRMSSPLPTIPASLNEWPDFPKKMEQYIDDHFGLRPAFLKLYHQLKNAINDSSSKMVVRGKEGWLFYGSEVDAYRHISRYTEAQLATFAKTVEYRRHWLKTRGIDYVIIIAPNKSTIYPEYMPDNLHKVHADSTLDQLLNYAKQHITVPIIDLRAPLIAAKNQGLLYYKYDTHWNLFGGNIAQYAIAHALETLYPNQIHPHLFTTDDYVFSRAVEGDLSNIIDQQPDSSLSMVSLKPSVMTHFCGNALNPSNENGAISIQCKSNSINAIVFRDSFFDALLGYIGNYFHNSTYLSIEFNLDIVKYFSKQQPLNLVIEEIIERNLPYLPQLDTEQEYEQLNPVFAASKQSVFMLNAVSLPQQNAEATHLAWQGQKLIIDATNTDSMVLLSLNPIHPKAQYLIKIIIEAPDITELQLFYAKAHTFPQFTDQRSKKRLLNKGLNTLLIPIDLQDFDGQLRLDPGSHIGRYIIHSLEIKINDLGGHG